MNHIEIYIELRKLLLIVNEYLDLKSDLHAYSMKLQHELLI